VGASVEEEVAAVVGREKGSPAFAGRPGALPRAAALSFVVGLIALRVCWLPGVNCLLAVAAVALGVAGLCQALRRRGEACGLDEAITGLVLGIIVLGLSTFFTAALVAAYR